MTRAKASEFGDRLRQARKAAGLSHDRLGAAAGTSRQHLIRLEKGLHRPSPELLARIASATGKPVEFFDEALREQQEAAADDEEAARAMALLDVLRGEIRRLIREEVAA